jgi:predicted ribosome quality control (RQC) complex YloA/Tae2 family protein
MLGLLEMRRAVEALAGSRLGARLERVVQYGEESLLLTLSGGGGHQVREKCHLVLDASRRHARLALVERPRPAPAAPPALAQYLRAHVAGGRLAEARLRSDDRQAQLRFETPEGDFALLLSVLGPRSNVYLLDAQDRIVSSLRPLEKTRRDLSRGAPWSDPESSPRGEGEDRFAEHEGEELLLAIERRYAEAESADDVGETRRRIGQALKKQAAVQARKEKMLRRDLEQAEQAEEWRRRGELLKGHLASVPAGREQVELRDWESGEAVVVPLDPKLSPAANMERCFKRHRKAVKQGERARVELGALDVRREELEGLRREFEAIAEEDGGMLDQFAARPPVQRLVTRFFPKPAASAPAKTRPARFKLGKREVPMRLAPKRYRTSDGLEVWVGKSDEGNDLLTTRLANGKDLFFHLEGSPGSHVVLRTEGRSEVPHESLLEASELAVHFSKQKKVTRAGVHVAAIKDVSKPKGAKPGLVYVHRGRTLQLRRDPARLERILGARIEEDSP